MIKSPEPSTGTLLGVDEWEALCKDRNALISVLVEPDGTTITSLTCRELWQRQEALHRAGSRSRAAAVGSSEQVSADEGWRASLIAARHL